MSTDAARTKLRELIATKQQWLRQWQAPELLSPGRSDMIQVLSDNIAELQQVLAELDKAEPQEPDSPERRCGGPGCDMRCCQPVQEPVAWRFEARHIDSAWAAAVTLKHPGPEGVYMRNVVPLYTAPPQRKPLTKEEIHALRLSIPATTQWLDALVLYTRAVERAHKIGGEG